jgi:hypothetical protein
MASLKNLIKDVKDPNDYDGAVFVCVKDGGIANFGFTGAAPQGIDQRAFLYRILMETQYALAFLPQQTPTSEPSGD